MAYGNSSFGLKLLLILKEQVILLVDFAQVLRIRRVQALLNVKSGLRFHDHVLVGEKFLLLEELVERVLSEVLLYFVQVLHQLLEFLALYLLDVFEQQVEDLAVGLEVGQSRLDVRVEAILS